MNPLAPEVTDLNRPYWDGAAVDELRHQHCPACGHRWLPAREDCPRCLATGPAWEVSSGDARLVSWVVYHRAFHPAFADRVPYVVGVVELAEGARMIAGIDDAEMPPAMDMALRVAFRTDDGLRVPYFRPAAGGAPA